LNVNRTSRASALILNRMLRPWYWWDRLYYLLPAGKKHKSVLNILHGFTKEVYKNANNMYLEI